MARSEVMVLLSFYKLHLEKENGDARAIFGWDKDSREKPDTSHAQFSKNCSVTTAATIGFPWTALATIKSRPQRPSASTT